MDSLCSARNTDEIAIDLFSSLSTDERWQLTSRALSLHNKETLHFFHVPKTGGTTFGESLGQRKEILYVAVDSTVELFVRSLFLLIKANHDYILTRGHHSLSTLIDNKAVQSFSSMFTFFRPAIEIHVSNVNMILRRLNKFANGEPLTKLERAFCEDWSRRIENDNHLDKTNAIKVLSSKTYHQEFSGIYSRFYNVKDWRKLVLSNHLKVFDVNTIDTIFTAAMGYETPPARRNVSDHKYLNVEDVPPKLINKLIADDLSITQFLENNLCDPTDFKVWPWSS